MSNHVVFRRLAPLAVFVALGGRAAAQPATDPSSAALAPPVVPAPGAVALSADPAGAASVKEPKKPDPFSFADWGWMNGNSRQTDFPINNAFMTGTFTIESEYAYEFSNPQDHSVVGSTAIGRSNELQIEHLGVGADFHWQGARGRIMTQLGLYATMTPRNDASPGRGQWNIADAYKYITEGYGGYHWDVGYGLNIDAGIFLSYIGLCSYYNYENWTDQASYVSSNTPWFFNGIRIQYFPLENLKIEPWIINGWQAYGEFNSVPGVGLQVAYRPSSWLALVGSQYFGEDTLGVPGRKRIHTDDSVLVKYYETQDPHAMLSRFAASLTVDVGCEFGDGNATNSAVSCFNGTKNAPSQYFAGAMLYNRFWFVNNTFGLTVGGGFMTNPGRYLVLTPPIDGATAFVQSPYFPQTPGLPFKAWDTTETFDYMPSQYVTFRAEYTHRFANTPYFAGPGGVTPPGGNDGNPGAMIPGWKPDLQKDEDRIMFAAFVRI